MAPRARRANSASGSGGARGLDDVLSGHFPLAGGRRLAGLDQSLEPDQVLVHLAPRVAAEQRRGEMPERPARRVVRQANGHPVGRRTAARIGSCRRWRPSSPARSARRSVGSARTA